MGLRDRVRVRVRVRHHRGDVGLWPKALDGEPQVEPSLDVRIRVRARVRARVRVRVRVRVEAGGEETSVMRLSPSWKLGPARRTQILTLPSISFSR